jgi:hypothetical protein
MNPRPRTSPWLSSCEEVEQNASGKKREPEQEHGYSPAMT